MELLLNYILHRTRCNSAFAVIFTNLSSRISHRWPPLHWSASRSLGSIEMVSLLQRAKPCEDSDARKIIILYTHLDLNLVVHKKQEQSISDVQISNKVELNSVAFSYIHFTLINSSFIAIRYEIYL